MEEIKIEEIPSFYFGQKEDKIGGTGCTVIICPEGAVCGVDVRGGSPSTRDTDALDPICNREVVHSVLLTGGSAFGLDAAGGIMKSLEARGIGRDVAVTTVPNVCAAVLFDLKLGEGKVRPDAQMGYEACEIALTKSELSEGSFGAGTGCAVGKAKGLPHAMKGGIGIKAYRVGELMLGAIMAVNCVGDVKKAGKIIAGCRTDDGKNFADGEAIMLENYTQTKDIFSGEVKAGNTVIGCIITNAKLSKAQMTKLASVGHNGLARAIYPAHSTYDGDTIFAMSHGDVLADADTVGILAAKAVEEAIVRAVTQTESLYGLLAAKDI